MRLDPSDVLRRMGAENRHFRARSRAAGLGPPWRANPAKAPQTLKLESDLPIQEAAGIVLARRLL